MNKADRISDFIKRGLALVTVAFALTATGALAQSRKAAPRAAKPTPQSKLKSEVANAKAELIKATTDYKASLTTLTSMYEAELKNAQQQLETRKQLFAQGILSKKDLDASEKQIAEAQAKIDGSRKQIAEADDLIAESSVVDDDDDQPTRAPALTGRYTSTSALIRYTGTAHWALSDSAKVGSYFIRRFVHQMPISAYGQTSTHDRLGFDHRNSVDVAVHPDSAEGQALMAYLKSAGIPFIAFRHAVSGSATGAHIHIGYPSHRIGVSASAR
jgi:hypothetical protein